MTLNALLAVVILTSAPAPHTVVERLFEAFNRHDTAALQALYAPGARLTSSDFCHPRTAADVPRTYTGIFRAFPNIHDRITAGVFDGDQAAVRFISTGTGAMGRLHQEFITYFRFRNGRIIEDDTVFDTKGRACDP